MTLTAVVALILAGLAKPYEAMNALQAAAAEYSRIVVIFNAVAVPAHMLLRSNSLAYVGMGIGESIGRLAFKWRLGQTFLVAAISLVMTYVMAGLFHNTTSILVSAAIITAICAEYKVPGVPVLSGALVASNLGGFSTRWGDTPNIVEAETWGLPHSVFFTQIAPVNVGLLILLVLFTTQLARQTIRRRGDKTLDRSGVANAMVGLRRRRRHLVIDKRLMAIGIIGLVIAVLGPLFYGELEIVLSLVAMAFCVLMDEKEHRSESLFALGLETYVTLASIFVLSKVVAQSSIGVGEEITNLLVRSNVSVWGMAIASYVGTLFTEAASWAAAAAPIIHEMDQSTRAAWALGGGIAAGSSSLITAATAGVILLHETSNNAPESRVTFGNYVGFGLSFSAFMLVYYILVLSLLF